MRKSIVKQKLSQRLPVHCFKSNIPHCMIPELIAGQGIECIWLDFEHFSTSLETAFSLVQACRGAGADSMLRVGRGEFARASRMLDLGASGIMYPRARSAAEAAELVEWLRFPPLGRRGVDTGVAAADYGAVPAREYIEWANQHTFLMVQIETPEALDQCEQIAALPGIDLLFVGTADLSIALNVPADPRKKPMLDCIERVARAADKHNKAWGMPVQSPDHGKELIDMGALFLSHGSDTSVIRQTIRTMQKGFRGLGIEYRCEPES